jgi:16S rRNA (uracil1498-N3)-methyltransferase
MPRFHCPLPLACGETLDLPPAAARHVQVLRLQPGEHLTLFNGLGGEFDAVIDRMGRQSVQVTVGPHHAVEREALREVHLVVGVPANERMDWLVEKLTELGAASLQPVIASRSVLRLAGERAQKKQQHWQAIAVAACEQSGRNRVPAIHGMADLGDWLATLPPSSPAEMRLVLSLETNARPLPSSPLANGRVTLLSGPEGGLTPAEEQVARAAGFTAVSLGARILRAETAPLAALSRLAENAGPATA